MEWEPPKILNPKYKGIWSPPLIKNPNFKGPWEPPMIKIKDPIPDPTFGKYINLSFLGLEFYQNSPGSIFDHFIVTDDEDYLNKTLNRNFFSIRDAEIRKVRSILERINQESTFTKKSSFDDLLNSDSDSDDYESPFPNQEPKGKEFIVPKIHKQRKLAKESEKQQQQMDYMYL